MLTAPTPSHITAYSCRALFWHPPSSSSSSGALLSHSTVWRPGHTQSVPPPGRSSALAPDTSVSWGGGRSPGRSTPGGLHQWSWTLRVTMRRKSSSTHCCFCNLMLMMSYSSSSFLVPGPQSASVGQVADCSQDLKNICKVRKGWVFVFCFVGGWGDYLEKYLSLIHMCTHLSKHNMQRCVCV